MRTGSRFASLVLVGLLPLLLACGGGSGDGGEEPAPPGPEATFQGQYHFSSLTLTMLPGELLGTPNHRACQWGLATSAGAGLMNLALDQNVENNLETGLAASDVPYTVGADRVFGVESEVLPGARLLEGGIAADGRFACAARIVADEHPSVHLFGRRGGVYSDATLDEQWMLCGFGYRVTVPEALYGSVLFDGEGLGAVTLHSNLGGVHAPPSVLPLTYHVSADGSTTFDLASLPLEGGVVAPGDVLVLGGSTVDSAYPLMATLIRASTGRTLADFDGQYFLTGYLHDLTADRLVAASGTLTADGVGGYTTSITFTDGVTVLEDVAGGGVYALSSVGALQLGNTLGDVYIGILSPDGSFASVGGTVNDGGDPTIFCLVR